MENLTINEKKERIKKLKMHCDISNACKKLGFAAQTYWNAMCVLNYATNLRYNY